MDNYNKEDKNKPKMPSTKGPKMPFNLYWIYLLVFGAIIGMYFFTENSVTKEVPWTDFQGYVENNSINKIVVDNKNNTLKAFVRPDSVKTVFKTDAERAGNNPAIVVRIPSADKFSDFYDKVRADYKYNIDVSYESSTSAVEILLSFLPILLIFGLFIYMMRRMSGGGSGGGGGVFSVGKSKAQLYDKGSDLRVSFKDVAGLSEAKEEIEEIVEFLKNPSRYTEIGGKIPKGALLVGPPGTGKTLLAKAVAGEANVPFFSLSGSDFVEMFVGVGASRVRDLFKQAKEKSPCIIFIDEIDAIGRARGKNLNMGSNDERENTLNQLLTEMDGFGTNSGIIILAATNRADILDKALLRAGRFDRQITVDLPDLNDRKEIFKVHLRPVKIDDTVDVEFLARQTPGFSGADIANVCNEAALIAARKGKKVVQKEDFTNAVDRIIGGLEKKNKVTTLEERKTIAIHEAGHATLSWFLEYANPLVKVTIVPRGKALGAAWYLPEERQITTKEQMLDEMCALLGGRAAEDVFIGHISSGAANDLERVTKQAYAMISYLGMSEKMPNLSYYDSSGEGYGFTKPYSEETALLIDKEVQAMINEQYERAKRLLKEHADGHGKLANLLIAEEVIFADDLKKVFGERQWVSRSEELLKETEELPKDVEIEIKKGEDAPGIITQEDQSEEQ
ncbi:cell division protease FtsH [Dysgonomonas sp. PFB1-18]|uniref:ATP-dependent zinc metalloprotease FtsH n=1 Tax=unclassified Dysgonomonas TaxID=2630389 RepID=UPI002476E601|nr:MULTISPECIES: ATP-dependent zinc metalloprotease FtsH [unclassified Dysgonomonas]MDH6310398.1 cell division protease FtsH [Dysgonomonas sp. PF1-14]MDH6340272.1 cell division protease FtsH [Dysgonomonas sp. PF1-16]MDH6381948.1 cell division protease FtsH [Dysgonomonas sp. PFB1-18]MDH6399243.1 cell division protease FtsH [Dysgonomonas sp. PF1-23]